MNKIKYVVFDCWDTVIKLIEKYPHSSILSVYDHIKNKEVITKEELIKQDEDFLEYYFDTATFDVDQKALFAYMCESLGIELDISYDEASDLSAYSFDAPMVENVDKFINFLKEHNIGCSILSNSIQTQEQTRNLLKKSFPVLPFDYVLASSNYGVRKPDYRFYNLIAKKVGHKNEEIAFIGDTFSADVVGANNANFQAFYFNWKNKPISEEQKKYKFTEFKSYLELIDIIKERI